MRPTVPLRLDAVQALSVEVGDRFDVDWVEPAQNRVEIIVTVGDTGPSRWEVGSEDQARRVCRQDGPRQRLRISVFDAAQPGRLHDGAAFDESQQGAAGVVAHAEMVDNDLRQGGQDGL